MPAQHFDEEIRQDPWDPSVKWATNQIQWLIKKVCLRPFFSLTDWVDKRSQGDTVNPDSPLVKRFEIRLKDGDTTRAWDAEIVVSNNEAEWLPPTQDISSCARKQRAGIEEIRAAKHVEDRRGVGVIITKKLRVPGLNLRKLILIKPIPDLIEFDCVSRPRTLQAAILQCSPAHRQSGEKFRGGIRIIVRATDRWQSGAKKEEQKPRLHSPLSFSESGVQFKSVLRLQPQRSPGLNCQLHCISEMDCGAIGGLPDLFATTEAVRND